MKRTNTHIVNTIVDFCADPLALSQQTLKLLREITALPPTLQIAAERTLIEVLLTLIQFSQKPS